MAASKVFLAFGNLGKSAINFELGKVRRFRILLGFLPKIQGKKLSAPNYLHLRTALYEQR
jgi:hypothetical protein